MKKRMDRKWGFCQFISSAVLALFALYSAGLFPHRTLADGTEISGDYFRLFGLTSLTPEEVLQDWDGDRLNILQEAQRGSDPYVADTDLDGWPDGSDSNATSRAVIYWGAPELCVGDEYRYVGPAWWLGASKQGGEWAEGKAWRAGVAESEDAACLLIRIDRAKLDGDLVLEIACTDSADSSLFVDLLNENGQTVADSVGNNLMTGTDREFICRQRIPISSYPAASTIRIRRGHGEITIFNCLLYVDIDGDGFDAEQEAQYGFSDLSADSRPDNVQLEVQGTMDNFPPSPFATNATWTVSQSITGITSLGILYVHTDRGSSRFDGYSPTSADGRRGPKATVQEAIEAAPAGKTIIVIQGNRPLPGGVLRPGNKSIILKPEGTIRIK